LIGVAVIKAAANVANACEFPKASLLGFNLWGPGVVTRTCTPRKTGTILELAGAVPERCWNVLEPFWGLVGTLLESCCNLRGTFLLELCGNLPGTLWNLPGTLLELLCFRFGYGV